MPGAPSAASSSGGEQLGRGAGRPPGAFAFLLTEIRALLCRVSWQLPRGSWASGAGPEAAARDAEGTSQRVLWDSEPLVNECPEGKAVIKVSSGSQHMCHRVMDSSNGLSWKGPSKTCLQKRWVCIAMAFGSPSPSCIPWWYHCCITALLWYPKSWLWEIIE